MIAKENQIVLGLLIISIHTRICWEAEIMVVAAGLGRALEISREVISWAFKYGCLRLVTCVAKTNRLSLSLNRRAGLKVYGINPKCTMRNGKLEDLVLLGISKDEFQG